ncbi:MAG TPA: hypothetical protein VN041_09655 [Microbacterium sp.]|nr:hypothetical protein [Microbacterium sp.]
MVTTITHSSGIIVPDIMDGFDAARDAGTLIHPVLGSPDPDVSLRPAGRRSGELRLVFSSAAGAVTAETVLAVPQVLALSDPDVGAVAMSFVVAGGQLRVEIDDETRSAWVLSVPFQEVSP